MGIGAYRFCGRGILLFLLFAGREDFVLFGFCSQQYSVYDYRNFIVAGFVKRINVYDAFIEGAKEGFKTAVMIIPYLVAILVAIGIFRASGAMDYIVEGFATVFGWLGIDTEFVGALPTALMKSLSGSGSRGMMVDAMSAYGVDSFVGRVACTVQGSTDTTFYILAVYFGSVGVRKTRYAVGYALLADVIGAISAITVSYFFFK